MATGADAAGSHGGGGGGGRPPRAAAISWHGLGYSVTPRGGASARLRSCLGLGRPSAGVASAPSAAPSLERSEKDLEAGVEAFDVDEVESNTGASPGGRKTDTAVGGDESDPSAGGTSSSSGGAVSAPDGSSSTATSVGVPKVILSDVDGAASAGELVWVMGASGSGKTTLLDALAGRLAGPLSGTLRLNGVAVAGGDHGSDGGGIAAYRRRIKFVAQEDALHEAFSVRETLTYAARFGGAGGGQQSGGSVGAVPTMTAAASVADRVQAVLDTLGLEAAADIKVGGTFYRGLSGGQKRRLSVGCQLLSRPDLLVLDEPLSGLDSYAAERVAAHLRGVAATGGNAVVASIHSPSVEVYGMAHRLCLLAAGRVVYFGHPTAAAAYFERQGAVLPPGRSVPEALLRLVNPDFGGRAAVARLCDAWAASDERAALVREGEETAAAAAAAAAATAGSADSRASPYALSWRRQVALLTHRVVLDAVRNPAVVWLRAAMYMALAVLIGLAWLRVPASADRIQDLLGALFFAQAFFVFMSIAALPSYLEEKTIVTAQRASGWYTASAYVLAHGVAEAAFLLPLSLGCCTVIWGMVGLNPDASRWAYFVIVMWVSLAAAEAFIILIASVVPVLLVGLAGAAFTFGFMMIVQGFFTRIANLGPLRWARWLSLHGYALGGFVANEFSGRTYAAAPASFPPFPEAVPGDTVVAALELPSTHRGVCVGVLLGMAVVFRVATWGWMAAFHTGKK